VEIRRARADELGAVGELLVEVYVGGGYIADDDSYVGELGRVSLLAQPDDD